MKKETFPMKIKQIFYSMILVLLISSIVQLPVLAVSYTPPKATFSKNIVCSTEATYANKIVWKYKTINGVLYKRQYNRTTNQWIGDWVKA